MCGILTISVWPYLRLVVCVCTVNRVQYAQRVTFNTSTRHNSSCAVPAGNYTLFLHKKLRADSATMLDSPVLHLHGKKKEEESSR